MAGVRCPDHSQSRVVRNGRRAAGRRQRYRCFPAVGTPHDYIEPLTTDLIGACLTCERDWDGGFPVFRHALYNVPVIAAFLRNLGRGDSLRMASLAARQDRDDLEHRRAKLTGHHRPRQRTLTEDCRVAADWILRYGSLVCRKMLPRRWPSVLVVDAQPFMTKSCYLPGHPKAGQPKPNGVPAFAVLAAGTRRRSGHGRRNQALKIVHVRAMPADHKGDWADFFRSLPGRPRIIISDPDPQISYAIKAVWPPGQRPRHLLSTLHYRNKVLQKFVRARWYPTTHQLAADAQTSFSDLATFRTWRARAEQSGPGPVKRWLASKGGEVEERLAAAPPTSTGDLDGFLTKIENHLRIGRGRVSNLRRLDVRLGLMALRWNRQDRQDTLEGVLRQEVSRPRVAARRSLDRQFYDPLWLLS
jgi:hypothetical protein